MPGDVTAAWNGARAAMLGADGSQLSFSAAYASHMVLQQAPARAVVWGYAPSSTAAAMLTLTWFAGSTATVATLSSFNSTASLWTAKLPPIKASHRVDGRATSYSLTISTGARHTSISDVLFGDVWVCSGQSNMAFLLEMDVDGQELVQQANAYPELRFMTTAKRTATTPQADISVAAPWARSSNVSVSNPDPPHEQLGVGDDPWLWMSAVCWIYGRQLHLARKVPIGLINTNWGGSYIEDWSSDEALAKCDSSQVGGIGDCHPGMGHTCPAQLWNAMVVPLLRITIRGAVWYQGESNVMRPAKYACQLGAMLTSWRSSWNKASQGETAADFAFGVVQISAVLAGDDTRAGGGPLAYALLRWYQTAATGALPTPALPNTFLAVTHDLGDAASPYGSVHTRYKQDIAMRLALAARRHAYAESVSIGPLLREAVTKASGEVLLSFDGVGASGLSLPPMHVEPAHQANWSGISPFELCTSPNGSAPTMACAQGALLAGGDLFVANMSVAAASALCLANSSCAGFTLRAAECSQQSEGRVYFKRRHVGANGDAAWRAYTKEVPCSLESKLAGWAPPASVQLVASGKALLLRAAEGNVRPIACRHAWRAYPCEHMGCGVYGKAGGGLMVPPSPFYVKL